MLVLTGPSASGKTETAKYIMEKYGLEKVVTCTSRAPRVGEKNDVDYHFLTKDQFREGKAKGEFLEVAEYNGNFYGTKKADVGPDKVSCVEPNGAHSYKKYLGNDMFCAYLDATEATRLSRMIDIRHDSPKAAEDRIQKDRVVYKDHGKFVKEVADFILDTDGLTIDEQGDRVYRAYQAWKAKRASAK